MRIQGQRNQEGAARNSVAVVIGIAQVGRGQ